MHSNEGCGDSNGILCAIISVFVNFAKEALYSVTRCDSLQWIFHLKINIFHSIRWERWSFWQNWDIIKWLQCLKLLITKEDFKSSWGQLFSSYPNEMFTVTVSQFTAEITFSLLELLISAPSYALCTYSILFWSPYSQTLLNFCRYSPVWLVQQSSTRLLLLEE